MVDTWDVASSKLIELTESGEIRWTAQKKTPMLREGVKDILTPVYTADVSGRKIAVYKEQVEGWNHLLEKPAIMESVVIEFVNENLESQWRWPSPKHRHELLDAIQYQISDAEGFIKSFLSNV